ncbi:DctP family TRAP transporter solute-binding subunit [Pseudarthrobacter phenanthrenivorans]|uniref:DctP family TRAP transporter solute-binding subunit n=2 Tax=Pseudarthrobacter phenanthrenivorans TaxID=361575 RepID=A0A3B0FYV7_PSEPS|nr:sialic acid TRAP transporter substrate-binding protein SiaP [Pseudarthrobacter phenanthrenivorans]ADX71340.1 tripartite ATP-independent periplasmic transporter solute receptor, DctP family [Pseudarthrobacter phenanthrenivorans Sphe3]RKO23507.1 DctP family TRAP transporter solute-binding subunit [Pseudarthrobacter phenanthrenivorans]TPV51048.1 DctP family TRAP transporter solute-binding subunit [Pseudarthrobacter phenanthrenivorans]
MKLDHSTPARRRRRTGAALGLAATAALLLSACNVGTPVDRDKAAQADAGAKTLRLAHVYDAGHPVEKCGIATLKKELEGSGLQVQSFPAAQLGSEAESLEQVSSGALDMAVAGPSFLGVWEKDAAVLDGAYLFKDVDHFVKTVEGDTMKGVFDKLYESSDLKVLSSWYYGTRHVTANKQIKSSQDFAGLKIRTPNAPLYLENIKAMGGTATPMALDEVYLALQQGAIDAQENPIPTIATAKFNEVQDYINLTGHMVQGVMITTGRSVYEGLTDEERSALEAAMGPAAEAARKCIEEQEQSILEEWKSGDGIKVNEDVDRESFAAAAEEAMLKQSWGELYRELKDAR